MWDFYKSAEFDIFAACGWACVLSHCTRLFSMNRPVPSEAEDDTRSFKSPLSVV